MAGRQGFICGVSPRPPRRAAAAARARARTDEVVCAAVLHGATCAVCLISPLCTALHIPAYLHCVSRCTAARGPSCRPMPSRPFCVCMWWLADTLGPTTLRLAPVPRLPAPPPCLHLLPHLGPRLLPDALNGSLTHATPAPALPLPRPFPSAPSPPQMPSPLLRSPAATSRSRRTRASSTLAATS